MILRNISINILTAFLKIYVVKLLIYERIDFMIGDMLSKIREDKNISKTNIAKETNINVGHLTHIEKGDNLACNRNTNRNGV